jgi:hypothetical protein
MKRISAGLALCLALSNPSSIVASPLIVAAVIAQICTPHLGKKILEHQDSMRSTVPAGPLTSTTSASTSPASAATTTTTTDIEQNYLEAQEVIIRYTEEHKRELAAMLKRFSKARYAVFGNYYFDKAKAGTLRPWEDVAVHWGTIFRNGARICFTLDQVNDEKFFTTLGLYYKPTHEAEPILLQRRRVDLPKTTMPKPDDADYNNDQQYVDALKADMQRYMDVSTADIRTLINNGHDVAAHYRKQTQLIESTN